VGNISALLTHPAAPGFILLILLLVAIALLVALRRHDSRPRPQPAGHVPPPYPGDRIPPPEVDNGGATRVMTDDAGRERVIYSPPPASVAPPPELAMTVVETPEREIYRPPVAPRETPPPPERTADPGAPAYEPPVFTPGETGGMIPMVPPPPGPGDQPPPLG
jgi:Wiskott-Aldrich syndrome protein